MGQPLYGRPTPDGYPLVRGEWTSPGQLAARFEVARGVGYRRVGAGFRTSFAVPLSDRPRARRSSKARDADAEWNLLLLSSPEFMQPMKRRSLLSVPHWHFPSRSGFSLRHPRPPASCSCSCAAATTRRTC